MKLLIVPSNSSFAEGNIFIARGETRDEYYQYFTITHRDKVISIRFEEGTITEGGGEINEVLDEIDIVSKDESIFESDFAWAILKDQSTKSMLIETAHHPISGSKYLKISGNLHTIQFDEITNIIYGKKTGEDYNYCNKEYILRVVTKDPKYATYNLARKGMETKGEYTLNLNVQLLKNDIIRVSITTVVPRFKVPDEALRPGFEEYFNLEDGERTLDDFVKISDDQSSFSLLIHEFNNTNNPYFKIDKDSLIMNKFYSSLVTDISTTGLIYGLGERVGDFFLKEGIYTTWSRDAMDPIDDGKPPGKNIYGSHPIYFTQSRNGNMNHWAMMNLNANAQDTKIKFEGEIGARVSHYISGEGIFDMYFIIEKKTPEDVVKAYHSLIGPTLLPPMWGLGWHQWKYGYKDTEALRTVYQKYQEGDFPMDVLWSDIDHMDRYRDFTFDKAGNYKDLDTFINKTLHANNRRYVPIIDAGIAIVNIRLILH